MTNQPENPEAAYIPDQRLDWLISPKRIRTWLGSEVVADSRRALLLRESGHLPVYYFPRQDVRQDLLVPATATSHCPYKGNAVYWDIEVAGRRAQAAVWAYPEPLAEGPPLADYMAFYWHAMDAWFEEDEQVFVHPRDPFKRVDILAGSRHVEIMVDGEPVADSRRPVLLFETGLPTRYYLPKPDIRLERMSTSDTITRCPYKGEARYYHLRTEQGRTQDLVWTYPYPTAEATKIAGLACFYDERVELYLDGERQIPPTTPWSSQSASR